VHNLQLATDNTHFLQATENLFRHAFGKIDEAVILANIDVPDVPPFEASLVSNRTDDIPRLHAMRVADFDPVRLELDAFRRTARLAGGRTLASTFAISAAVGTAICGSISTRTMARALGVVSNVVYVARATIALVRDEARMAGPAIAALRTRDCVTRTPIAAVSARMPNPATTALRTGA
jgi:hypothetical protein